MKVSLKSRTTNVPIDSPVELLCTVKGPKVSLAVRWMFQPRNSTVQTNILSIRHTGEIAWRADQRNYQLSIQALPTDTRFTLMLPRASKQQEGQYQCQVDAYQKDVQKALKNSNLLAVTVQKTGKYSYLLKIYVCKVQSASNIGHTLVFILRSPPPALNAYNLRKNLILE